MEFFETQWNQFLSTTAKRLKGVFYEHSASPLIFLNDCEYVGDGEAFAKWALHNFNHKDDGRFTEYEACAAESLRTKINKSKTCKYAQLSFECGGKESAVILELFAEVCPQTVENFLSLCKGAKTRAGTELCYKGTEIHRVVQGMFVQGGRIKDAVAGTASAFGEEFSDESFHFNHAAAGMLGMCKRGGLKHTNES